MLYPFEIRNQVNLILLVDLIIFAFFSFVGFIYYIIKYNKKENKTVWQLAAYKAENENKTAWQLAAYKAANEINNETIQQNKQIINDLEVQKQDLQKKVEDLTCKLAAARSKLNILLKDINIPRDHIINFLLKYETPISPDFNPSINYYNKKGEKINAGLPEKAETLTNYCLFCDAIISQKKTFCNKECQDAYRLSGYKSLQQVHNENPELTKYK